jgi:hypothetical protein
VLPTGWAARLTTLERAKMSARQIEIYGRSMDTNSFVRRYIYGGTWHSGMNDLAALEYSSEKVSEAFIRLMEVLAERNLLTDEEILHICSD